MKQITPAIDRCYPLGEVPEAIRYLEQRQVKGCDQHLILTHTNQVES